MRYKQRIIKHNIDVPRNIPSDTIELNEIKYDPSVISHHPKSFEYFFTHGILINDERYIIKEFYVKYEDVYAVVTKDEIKYFELRMNYCSKPVLDKILKDLEKVKNSVENNKPVLTGRTLTINGSSVELPDDTQELSLRDHKLILSKGNSVDLPEYDDSEVKSRLNTLETREDNDKQTLSINERTVSISNGNSIELPEDRDTVYDDSSVLRRLDNLESKQDNDKQTLSLEGRTLSISSGNYVTLPEDRDTVYNDSEIIRRLNALEGKTDNFVNGASVTREGNKVTITYTFVNGDHKVIEFEDHDTLGVAYDDTAIIERLKALETKQDKDTIYDDREVKDRLTRLESRSDNDNQTLSLDSRTRVLSISNGNSIPLPNDTQFITKRGNKLVLSNNGGEVELPQPNNVVPYDDTNLKSRVKTLEDITNNSNTEYRWYKSKINNNPIGSSATIRKSDLFNNNNIKVGDIVQDYLSVQVGANTEFYKVIAVNGEYITVQKVGKWELRNDRQTISKQGNKIVLSNGGGEVDIPQPNLSGYVPIGEYNKIKGALEKLLTDLKNSGAWKQTGSTVFEGEFYGNRHIATGNINVFGGTPDGGSFIRTSNNKTENDLAGG